MGFFDKLKFWKKDEGFDDLGDLPEMPGSPTLPPPMPGEPQLGLPTPLGQGLPQTPMPPPTEQQEFQVNEPIVRPAMAQQPQQPPIQQGGREHELMLSKLDSIKHILDNILLRLERLENKEQRPSQRRVW